MSHSAVQTLWPQTTHDEVDTNVEPDVHLVDCVTAQERMRNFPQMPHLAKGDAAVELMAWAIVLGVLFTAIRLVGAL
ncbi:MAG: hypothetical protein ABI980_14590 [Nitrospirota bacterium]